MNDKSRSGLTAAELLAELSADPAYQEMRRAKDEAHAQLGEERSLESFAKTHTAPILRKL